MNDLIDSDSVTDPFSELIEDATDGGFFNSTQTTSGPTSDQQSPDVVDLGKSLLNGYANWKDDQNSCDPQENPLHYLWHDAPELLLAAIIAGYLGYKSIQGRGAVASSTSETEGIGTSTQPILPLENRPYRIFVSHSWKYSDHHERIEAFLDDEDQLE